MSEGANVVGTNVLDLESLCPRELMSLELIFRELISHNLKYFVAPHPSSPV